MTPPASPDIPDEPLRQAIQRSVPRRDGDWYPSEVDALLVELVPLIEARVRQQIADDIQAARQDARLHGTPGGRAADDWLSGIHDGLRRAAHIARGDTK